MKKLISLSLALLMLISLLAGCGGKAGTETQTDTPSTQAPPEFPETQAPEPEPEPEGGEEAPPASDPGKGVYTLPLVDEPITLTVFEGVDPKILQYVSGPEETLVNKELAERTGVHLEYRAVNGSNENEQFMIMIGSGEYDDLITQVGYKYGGGIKPAIDDGVILDLAPLIRENAPNFGELIESDEDIECVSVLDDGRIGCFPVLYSTAAPCNWGMMLRTDWLEELGLELPETIEDYENVLKAFKSEKNAVMWMNAKGVYRNSLFASAYGVADYYYLGRLTMLDAFYLDQGEVKFGLLEDGFMDYLTLMNSWYSQGLIDPDFMSGDVGFDWLLDFACEDVVNGKYGVWVAEDNDIVDYEPFNAEMVAGASYTPVLNHGDKIDIGYYNTHFWFPGYSVSTSCEYPEIAVQFCDYRFSEEGSLLCDWGIEGVSFYYNEDGEPRYTELITDNPDGIPMSIARTIYAGTSPFSPYDKVYFMYPQNVIDCIPIWESNYTGEKTFPALIVNYDEEESELRSLYENSLLTYISENVPNFIVNGVTQEDFDRFRSQLREMHIEELMEAAQNAYDRMFK